MRRACLTAALALTLACAADLHAQTIIGTVWDSASNSKVAGAQVMLLQPDSSQSMVTDATGRFYFRALKGLAGLRISALGYADLSSPPFELEQDEKISLLIYVSATPVEIMPIVVIAKSRIPPTNYELFEQRRKSAGSGHFLDEKALQRVYATQLTDYLRRVPGVTVERDMVRLRPFCGEPMYVVDGIEFRPPIQEEGQTLFGESGQSTSATEQANAFVSPESVVAIEVYKDHAPPELQGGLSTNWPCGVVVIWTRRR